MSHYAVSPRSRATALILSVALLTACRQEPDRPTAAPDSAFALTGGAEIPHGFTRRPKPAELPDGRLVVFDGKDGGLKLVDPATGSVKTIAGTGSGPFEYSAFGYVMQAGDTAVLYDMMQQRLVLVGPSGAPARTVSLAEADPVVMSMTPQGLDAAGNLYGMTIFEGGTLVTTSDGKTLSEDPVRPLSTIPIRRFDIRSKRLVTLAELTLSTPDEKTKTEQTGTGQQITIPAASFEPRGLAWTPMVNGRVALFQKGEYRALFIGERDTIVGPAITYTPVPVTAAERRAADDSMVALVRATMTRPGSTASLKVVVGESRGRSTAKPPYGELFPTPTNFLWVQTPMPGVGGPGRFDVLDSTGRRLLTVTLPAGEPVICVGRKAVYTMRKDADDFYYIRTYALPAAISR
jgi:hypothetical protein